MRQITEVTRRDIFDVLENGFTNTKNEHSLVSSFSTDGEENKIKIQYWGRLNEVEFLKRLYNLRELPSYDNRFKDAEGEIWQHTVNNDDYPLEWVFEDERFFLSDGNDDEFLLKFLCEIFHPTVRCEEQDWNLLLEKLNEILYPDGYAIYPVDYISGREIYGWKELQLGVRTISKQMDDVKLSFNSDYVKVQIDLMQDSIEKAPHFAIGKAKELLDICCKTILDEQGIPYKNNLDLVQLMKTTCDSIGLNLNKPKDFISDQDIAGRVLGNLRSIVQGIAELRNRYGDGHGKNKNFQPLEKRYADLAVGSSVTAVNFMWNTYQKLKKDS